MKTDTSEFSLKEVLSNIAQFNDLLTFKPLGHYIGGMPHEAVFTDVLAGYRYHFYTWPATMMRQGTIELKDRVFRILVHREIQNADLPTLGNVKYVWLVLRRSDEGGSFLLPYIQKASFEFDLRTKLVFSSVNSEIVSLRRHEKFTEMVCPPTNFPEKFWEQVNEWVRSSIESRQRSIAELEKLSTSCVIEQSKYAAQILIEQTAIIRQHYATEHP